MAQVFCATCLRQLDLGCDFRHSAGNMKGILFLTRHGRVIKVPHIFAAVISSDVTQSLISLIGPTSFMKTKFTLRLPVKPVGAAC